MGVLNPGGGSGGAGEGDVKGPAAAVATDLAVFEGGTGKKLGDSGVPLSSVVSSSGAGAGKVPVANGSNGYAWTTPSPGLSEAEVKTLAAAAAAVGTTSVVYVSKGGSDSNNGATFSSAFLTAKKAVEAIEASSAATGTIWFGVGTWEEAVTRPTGCNVYGQGGKNLLTILKLPASTEKNVLQDASWGSKSTVGNGGEINHICIDGNYANQSMVAPETYNVVSKSVTSAGVTLEVGATTNFPSSGILWVGPILCTYTGTEAGKFTGVKPATGNTFNANAEVSIWPAAGVGNGIAIQSESSKVGMDVFVKNTVGQGIAVQGAGETGADAFNNILLPNKIENAHAYGIAVFPFAPDGMVGFAEPYTCGKGSLLLGSNEWEWVNIHCCGADSSWAAYENGLIRICRPMQNFLNLNLDYAPYNGIVIDEIGMANPEMNDIQIQGFSEGKVPSGTSDGGSVVQFYGNPAVAVAERFRLSGTFGGRWDCLVAPCPHDYLVGEQNLKTISEASGKVQVLRSLGLSPTSALGGKLKFASGDELNYTSTSSYTNALRNAVSSGATEMEPYSVAGLEPSGTVTVSSNSTSGEAKPSLRVKYTEIVGSKLKGCTGITENLAANTGVAQHFVKGVTGGTNNGVADNTNFTQPGREFKTISGEANAQVNNEILTPNLTPLPAMINLARTGQRIYRVLYEGNEQLIGATTATTTALGHEAKASLTGANGGKMAFYVNPADYPPGSTLRVVLTVVTNGTAPASNFTAELLPVSGPEGTIASEVKWGTVGSAVAGSTALVTAPALKTVTEIASTNFAVPAAGMYALGLVISANLATLTCVSVRGRVEVYC